MSAGLIIGITQQQNALTLVAIARGAATRETRFPKSAMSAEAIRIDLNDHEGPVGLAVDEALIDFAFAWGRGTLATTTLVALGAEAPAEMLARYASHAL
jgi:hypothetical protein